MVRSKEGKVPWRWTGKRQAPASLVINQKTVMNDVDEASDFWEIQFTMGLEPKILSGEKQGTFKLGPG